MIENIYSYYSQNFLIDTDTRNIRKGSVFFALKGVNFDGNLYIDQAITKGAILAVTSSKTIADTNPKTIFVEDTLVALQELATYHRRKINTQIIGLTGSNGKTTTKELIHVVLQKKYNTIATIGNLNNHIGVPLTLLSIKPDTEIAIVEMGANHQKEIELLCNIAQPNYGYITNFGKAHLEGFGGIEGVIKGKSELYDYLRNNDRTAFINNTDKLQIEKSKGIKTIPFTSELSYIKSNPLINLSYLGKEYETKLIGSYNYNNIAAAITIGEYFKVDGKDIIDAITSYIPNNNRSQIINKNGFEIILDAYNANPSSMKVAIENFQGIKKENKILILGDMFELGESAISEHNNIAKIAIDSNADKVILVGENFYNVSISNVSKFKNFESLKEVIKTEIPKNSNLLIKGSRGMALERILDEL